MSPLSLRGNYKLIYLVQQILGVCIRHCISKYYFVSRGGVSEVILWNSHFLFVQTLIMFYLLLTSVCSQELFVVCLCLMLSCCLY
jgi:hypothetical protein